MPALTPRLVPAGRTTPLNVMGSPTLVYLPAAHTGGHCSVIELRGETGVGIPMHVHDREDEIFHILEGTVRFDTPEGAVEGGPGSTIFGPRGHAHAWSVTQGPARILMVVTPGGIERMFEELDALCAHAMPEPPAVAEVCARYGIRFA